MPHLTTYYECYGLYDPDDAAGEQTPWDRYTFFIASVCLLCGIAGDRW